MANMMAKPYVVFAVVFGVALRARNAAKSFATHPGVKRTCPFALQMSAFDPKRTSDLAEW
jgi:hypothetical protein